MNDSYLNDFLFSSFFNIKKNEIDNKEVVIPICCNRAYLDMCRTIRFSNRLSVGQKKEWKDNLSFVICQSINQFISGQKPFDIIHNEICNQLIMDANNGSFLKKPFKYGQAQKWLNMTLKYAFLLHVFDNVDGFEEKLHVTIDRYIIREALSSYSVDNNEYALGIDRSSFPEEESWSRWEYKDYAMAQEVIRNHVVEYNKRYKKSISPFLWEMNAWIEQARIESQNDGL